MGEEKLRQKKCIRSRALNHRKAGTGTKEKFLLDLLDLHIMICELIKVHNKYTFQGTLFPLPSQWNETNSVLTLAILLH